jgi:hypothetical protein
LPNSVQQKPCNGVRVTRYRIDVRLSGTASPRNVRIWKESWRSEEWRY